MKRLADILLSLAALLLLAACTDDADVYNTPASSEGNLCVYVPVTREGDEVKSSLDPSNPTYNASVDECQINDLHLYAFPVEGKGTFLSQDLPSPEASNMLDENVAFYQLQIKPGEYRVYVVANMNDVLKDTPINTEEDLKKVVLSYNPMSKSGMLPVAKNIPMIYDPTKAADGSTTVVTIKNSATNPQKVAANLQFSCVKVCLNLVYDPDAEGVSSALKKGLQITDVKAERLSPETKLVWDGKFSNPNLDAGSIYAKGLDPTTLYPNSTASTANGAYYSKWTENTNNANVNDQNIVTVDPKDVVNPVKPKEPWLFRATYYLPERYVADSLQQSALKIGGKVAGHNNSYNIKLGHRQDEKSTTEVPTFPRGTYYEIVGRIKSLGNIDLDCVVGVKDWEPAEVDADFTHTTLWVSKTKAEVKSLQDDYIDYVTNADPSTLKFECISKVNKTTLGDLEIIKVENYPATKRLKFSINPELSIADFGTKTEGDAKVSIKVNNLKKYLNVHYNVTPYFKVDPVDIVIFYDKGNTAELTKSVKFTTNLGGIKFPDGWTVSGGGHDVTYANSTINIKCKNTQSAEGTFTITATSDPQTTTTHTFTVKSIEKYKDADGNEKYMEQPVRVTVRPPKGNYFIYMRAINDLVWCKGDSNDDYQHNLMLDEDSRLGTVSNNWRDGWWEAQKEVSNDNWQNVTWDEDFSPHNDYHYVYVYTQIGETKPGTGSQDRTTKEWYFVKPDRGDFTRHTVSNGDDSGFGTEEWWPGHSMKADGNNPGWYYLSIPTNQMSVGKKVAKEDKMINPGQTLLIFSNGTYLSKGFQSHRFTHHNDPGITLFNYEDNEGWYLYDPTSDPYYKVFDEKPTIVDVEYTIYTKYDKISGWFVNYGVKNGGGTEQFEMKSDNPNVVNEFTCVYYGDDPSDNKAWYKTILHLKAPLGEYDKNLHVNIKNSSGLVYDKPLLFDGDSYPVTGTVKRTINGRECVRYVIEGSYDPGSGAKFWKKGRPTIK
ncbi:fimbrial protein [Prevotella merdae]|uniref:fimbrial protein n=1 Tax=Prevotella merdae TaxID=2079531 RepID=UPI000D0FF16D|nr:fimbrial protein [Prevotella merdae]